MIVNALIVVASFLVVLSLLVFIHELGHYGIGKLFGTKVERFSIGFGKPVARLTTKSGEEWLFSRWPLGGYVKFAGDLDVASRRAASPEDLRHQYGDEANSLFELKPLWQRTLIVAAGPMANFVLAILIFFGLTWALGEIRVEPVISEVVEGGAAEASGFEVGDKILSIDGRNMEDTEDARTYIALRADETLRFRVERDGREVELSAIPERKDREDAIGGSAQLGTLGVRLGGPDYVSTVDFTAAQSLSRAFERFGETVAMTGTYVGRLFQGKEDGKALGGVLRIAAVTGKVAVDTSTAETVPLGDRLRAMTLSLLGLMALLSIGLGLANLLPIPALDGGHLLFYGYEALAGKPLSQEAQAIGYRLGAAMLIGAFVFLTFNDVGYIRSLFS